MARLTLLTLLICLFAPAQASEPERHHINSQGHTLALWEKSTPHATRSILLLHGRTYSALPDFDLRFEGENLSMMDALVEKGFTVYALDGRGYGATARDSSGWLTPETATMDALEAIRWIKARDNRTPHVFGWSYGSMVAQLLAQRHGSELVSIMLFGYPFDPNRHILASDHQYPEQPPAKPNTAKHAASDFIVEGAISQAGIDAYVQAALDADPIRVDFKDLHQWAALAPDQVTIPTLLIQAVHDPIAPTHIQQTLFTQLGTAEKWWVVLPEGSHAALLEKPRFKMFDAIEQFAKTVD